jgi:hypothetical protein
MISSRRLCATKPLGAFETPLGWICWIIILSEFAETWWDAGGNLFLLARAPNHSPPSLVQFKLPLGDFTRSFSG